MTYFFRFTGILLLGAVLLLTSSCQELTPIAATDSPTNRMLPTSIDYYAEGTLSHLVYRSLFVYNATNQLQSVRDSLLMNSPVSKPIAPWVQFVYANNRLTSIALSGLSNDLDSIWYTKPARFDLTYAGQTLYARLLVDNQEIKQASFNLDEQGYPVKTNVTLGRLSLDSRGHLDYITESMKSKALNPNNFFEVLEQQYDQNQNVFVDSKEYQILAALLATFNRSVGYSTGLVGLDNALTSNNLVYRTVKHCTALYGCNINKFVTETPHINKLGFPTQRNAPVGAMGIFHYTITYKQVD